MRWRGGRESENVEDYRGRGPVVVGGGLGVLVLIVLGLVFGIDPQSLLQIVQQQPDAVAPAPADGPDDEQKQFVSVVLADTEDVWSDLFERAGREYRKPHLVLYSGQVNSACGFASAAVGPFYCPGDERVYLDTSFFQQLSDQFAAPGDFAKAYVIAHEIGHHVQNLLGISEQVQAMRRRGTEVEANELSVRLELQADFYAGVWAHHAQRMKNILEAGDIEDGLRAASAVGDDRLQRQARGYVVPDSFTHGTSEQRARWFRRGYETGDMSQGDTFAADRL